MIVLFGLAFSAAIAFIIYFLIVLPQDLKKLSLRPLFILLFIIALWVGTLSMFLAPENSLSTLYPSYNVISGSSTIQYPSYTVVTSSVLSVRAYNAYFYIWLSLFTFILFLLLFWFLLLLRARAAQLLKGGRDVVEEFELNWGRK